MNDLNQSPSRVMRERAVELVSDAFAVSKLNEQELDDRMEQIEEASSVKELELALHGLSDGALQLLRSNPEGRSSDLVVRAPSTVQLAAEAPESRRSLTIFSESKRDGKWTLPRLLEQRVIFGSMTLDLREAFVAPGTSVVDIVAVFGELLILVPPGLEVDVDCSSVLAEVESRLSALRMLPESSATASDRPTVLVRGSAVLSSIVVEERMPGESKREAKKRRKQEKKMLKAASR